MIIRTYSLQNMVCFYFWYIQITVPIISYIVFPRLVRTLIDRIIHVWICTCLGQGFARGFYLLYEFLLSPSRSMVWYFRLLGCLFSGVLHRYINLNLLSRSRLFHNWRYVIIIQSSFSNVFIFFLYFFWYSINNTHNNQF